jgi:hypothetical protein
MAMTMRQQVVVAAAGLLLGIPMQTLAQAPDDSRQPQPSAASCEKFAGAAKEQCLQLLEERRKADLAARQPGLRRNCDALIGQEKESCLRQGGTVQT